MMTTFKPKCAELCAKQNEYGMTCSDITLYIFSSDRTDPWLERRGATGHTEASR